MSDSDKVETPPTDVTPSQEDKVAEAYLLSFRDKAEAEKGYKEVQAAKTRAEQRAAELEKRVLEAENKAEISRQINELAKAASEKSGRSVADERARLKEKYSEMMAGTDAADAILDMGERVASAMDQSTKELKDQLEKRTAELERQLSDLRLQNDPFYQQNRDLIESLVEETGSRSAALKVVKKMAISSSATQSVVSGAPAPGSTAQSRPAPVQARKMRALTKEERQVRKEQYGWTDAECDANQVEA